MPKNYISMSPTNLAHQRFIAAMKEHSNATRAYQAAYPGTSYASAKAHASRLLKNPYVRQQLSEYHVSLDEQATKATRAATILRLQEYYQRQAELLNIIEGGPVEKRGRNGKVSLQPATIADKLRAARSAMSLKDAFMVRNPWLTSVHENWENG